MVAAVPARRHRAGGCVSGSSGGDDDGDAVTVAAQQQQQSVPCAPQRQPNNTGSAGVRHYDVQAGPVI